MNYDYNKLDALDMLLEDLKKRSPFKLHFTKIPTLSITPKDVGLNKTAISIVTDKPEQIWAVDECLIVIDAFPAKWQKLMIESNQRALERLRGYLSKPHICSRPKSATLQQVNTALDISKAQDVGLSFAGIYEGEPADALIFSVDKREAVDYRLFSFVMQANPDTMLAEPLGNKKGSKFYFLKDNRVIALVMGIYSQN